MRRNTTVRDDEIADVIELAKKHHLAGHDIHFSLVGQYGFRFDARDANGGLSPLSPEFTMVWAAERWLQAYVGSTLPATVDPTRPRPTQHRAAYDYAEISSFVETKYGLKLRGYKREVGGEFRDFWHFVTDKVSPHRNSCFTLSDETGDGAEEWQREILALFLAEFGNPIYIWLD